MSAVVIAGAGITGLITAVRCARAGHRVTVVDRGPIPNQGSSSFDQHRVLRALTAENTGAAAALHRRWLGLQALLGGRFYRRVGVVSGWPAEHADAARDAADRAGVRIAVLEPDRLPHIVFPEGYLGVRELDAGVLLAERVLHAAVRWLRGHPAVTLRPWTEVVGVDTAAARLELADGGCLAGDLVLVAAGAWTRDLVRTDTEVHRQTIVYVRPPAELERWWQHAPTAGGVGDDGTGWLLPPGDGTLLKLSSTTMCRTVSTLAEPDDLDRATADHCRERLLAGPRRYPIVAIKHCHYTVDARTGGAALERVGPAVWARAAVGGDGFRTAPLIADRIAELAATPLAA
ncbi:FAD-binding oxidoreductase [Nocardia terpenica]|uniref:NAD(P)/FAD-dependent oxidoreductase n=1 Tax=Nocardia terpenica TaxID=455432 RepID=UPI001895BD66|nr:FAD-binding oxidoreductase [Nocardia terpenica]MBF6059750.1 FAD-binding oxidoreductase [Nocardia terpenica]MBF6102709.1 FAD-binding oxidoreductase [Nocardia terpenica]MBF6111100.1 FAD-binding oxidoreductase [Nocardia terpenica]MBF6117231.1 FAD-binding oxidoreductase [Nocardia terpenica]MBF6150928.1 FAD-binding oxidoreductase [Nocardia terpenica]